MRLMSQVTEWFKVWCRSDAAEHEDLWAVDGSRGKYHLFSCDDGVHFVPPLEQNTVGAFSRIDQNAVDMRMHGNV